MAQRFDRSTLTNGATFLVQGKVDYCRITKRIEGDALAEDIKQQSKTTQYPITVPYTKITIYDAVVMAKDPNNMTPEEQFGISQMYARQKYPNSNCFSAVNKSPKNLPAVCQLQSDGKTMKQIVPEGELAQGLTVILTLRVFKSKNYTNLGVTLDAVTAVEPIRYYTGSAEKALAEYGFSMVPLNGEDAKKANEGYMNAPQPEPVSAPNGNPYSTQPAAQAPQQAAAQATPFQPQQQYQQPAQAVAAPNMAAQQAAAAPSAMQGSENMGQGIVYDGMDRQYN